MEKKNYGSQEIIFPAFCVGYDKYQMYFCAYIHTQMYTQERERQTERNLFIILLSSYISEPNLGIHQTTSEDTPMSVLSQCNCRV